MNNQQIFNKAYLGLKSQDFKKSSNGAVCMYRGPKGLKCAIGHCIDDKYYQLSMESLEIGNLCNNYEGLFNSEQIPFLKKLQETHDWSDSPDDMKNKFYILATEYSLTVPE